MTILGTAFIEVAPETSKFASKLSSDVKQSVDRAASESASSFDKLAGVGEAAFIAVGTAAVTFGGIAVAAALKGEEATAQLANAITNAGGSFDAVKPQVEALSDRFVKFGFDNVEVEKGLTRLVQITGDTGESMKLMGTAANLAAARHLDLESAATLVGKAAEGNVIALKRLGITIDATGTTSEKAAEAIKQLNERFGGAAQAEADTYAGKLKAFHAEVSNLSEKIGNALLPVLASFVGDIGDGIGFLEKHTAVTKALAVVIGGPLVIAMGAYVALQAKALGLKVADLFESAAASAKKLASAMVTVTETETGSTVGLSKLGAGAIAATGGFVALELILNHTASAAAKMSRDIELAAGSDPQAQIDALTKKQQQLKAEFEGVPHVGFIWLTDGAAHAKTASDKLGQEIDRLKAQLQGQARDAAGAAGSVGDLSSSMDELTQKASGAGSATDKFSAGVNALQSTLINVDKTTQAHRDALRAVGDASDNVAKAQKALSDLQKKGAVDATAVAAAHKGEEDAIRKVADANYNAEQAQTDLNKLLLAGAVDVKAVTTAQEDLERSSNTVADAQRKLADAQQHFQEVAAGTSAEDLGKGQLSLSDAQRTLEKAQLDVVKATDDQQKAYSGVVPTVEDKEKADIALTKAQRDNTDAIDKVNAALDAQKREHESTTATTDTLAAADRLVTDAQLAARESAIRLTDAQAEYNRVLSGVIPTTEDKKRADLALADAQANVTKATFAVTDATKALDDMRAAGKPGAKDYEDAQSAITDASKTLSDALDAQKKATENLQTVQMGDVDFAQKVEDAKRKVADATQGVTDATDAQTAAHDALTKAQAGDPDFSQKMADAAKGVRDARNQLGDATQHTADTALAAYDAQTKANNAIRDAGPLAGGLKDQLNMISGQYPGLKSISDLVGSLNTQLGQSGFFQYLAAVASAATTPFSITLDTKGLPHFKGVQTAAEGGWVKGPVGAPVPLIAHGGEFVLSREMLANGQAMGGGGVTVAPGAVVLNFAAGTDRATADYARDQFAQVMGEVLDRAAAGAGARHS